MSGFHVTTEISDPWPSIYWKRSDSTLQFHSEGYKEVQFRAMEKEREFNFESKVTLEELFTSH
jgi:hypothetical protein